MSQLPRTAATTTSTPRDGQDFANLVAAVQRRIDAIFSEDCCLLKGTLAGLRLGKDQQEDPQKDSPLASALQQLKKAGQSIDNLCRIRENERKQFRHQVVGTAIALQAAIKKDNGLPELLEAAKKFNEAWPAEPASNAATSVWKDHPPYFQDFLSLCESEPTITRSIGFWYAWDIFDAVLRSEPVRPQTPDLWRTASTPVLFYSPGGSRDRGMNGVVGWLTVELIKDGGATFTPDFAGLGLTALTHGVHGFHEAMQRAWRLSNVASLGWRARWRIGRLSNQTDVFAPPCLDGRSVEPAVCCALWAAAGGIPGEPEEGFTFAAALELDPWCAVTAMLDDKDNVPLRRGEIQLHGIQGEVDKFHAAQFAGLDPVLVADDQEPTDAKHWPEGLVVRKKSVGEAFRLMESSVRHLRTYQQHIVDEWRKKWRDEADVPEGELARS